MKKQIRAAALALCTLMLFAAATGCGKQEKPTTEQPALETVEYSNLTDDDSRKQLSQLLSYAGIEESRIAALTDRADHLNGITKTECCRKGSQICALQPRLNLSKGRAQGHQWGPGSHFPNKLGKNGWPWPPERLW